MFLGLPLRMLACTVSVLQVEYIEEVTVSIVKMLKTKKKSLYYNFFMTYRR